MDDSRLGLPSASSMDRLYHCPGSRALSQLAPSGTASDEAIEGSAIAEALEKDSDEGLDDAGKNIRQRLSQMEQQAIDDWAREKQIGTATIRLIREGGESGRFWIRDRTDLHLLASARPDVVAVAPPFALVINHKTGFLDVPHARGNIQTRVEVLAAWHDLDGLQFIRGAIAQYRFRGKFSATDYDPAFLQRSEQELIFNLWRSEQEDAPRTPGYWCRYCPACQAGICPEAKVWAALPLAVIPSQSLTKEQITAELAQLDLQTSAFLQHRKSMIVFALDGNTKNLKSKTPEELAAYGLQLVPSSGVRTLPDVQALWTTLHAQGVSETELRTILRATYGSVQELMVGRLKKANPELTDKDAQAQADKILEPAVKIAPRDPSLKSL